MRPCPACKGEGVWCGECPACGLWAGCAWVADVAAEGVLWRVCDGCLAREAAGKTPECRRPAAPCFWRCETGSWAIAHSEDCPVEEAKR
jgi:hypothetical protein